jgi:hypothetical protein
MVLALVLAILNGLSQRAFAYYYLGNGYWFGQTTVWIHNYGNFAFGYDIAAYNAQSSWTANTQVYLADTSPDYEDIAFVSVDYGATGWYGYGLVCTTSGCGSGHYNDQYVYAEARLNRYSSYGIDGWSGTKKKAAYAHEIGHTLSLAHNTGCGSCLMYPDIGTFYDVYGTSGVTSDEINGINDRY